MDARTTQFLFGEAWARKKLQDLAMTKIQRLIKLVTDFQPMEEHDKQEVTNALDVSNFK